VESNLAEDFGITVKRSNSICFKTLVKTEISFSKLPRLTHKPFISLEEITDDEKDKNDLDL
jgi:hypothetical protein